MSTFSPDPERLRSRIRSLSCPRCRQFFTTGRYQIDFRRTRIDVYHSCGQLTSFTAPALRNDYTI